MANRMKFIASYRGTFHYEFAHPSLGRIDLRYRNAKDHWRNNPTEDGRKEWNFPDRDTFEHCINSSHGILLNSHEAVDSITLQAFQEINGHPEAKTGFYCHLRNRVVTCKPAPPNTKPKYGQKTWHRKLDLQLAHIQNLVDSKQIHEALLLVDKMPTCLDSIKARINKIFPQWEKVIPFHLAQAA